MITEMFILLALVLSLLHYIYQVRPPNFPPGPTGIPLLGYIPFLSLPIHKKIAQLSQVHGKIFGMILGHYKVVVVSDVKLLKKLFNNDRLQGRPGAKALTAVCLGKIRGLGLASGKAFQEQRRFVLRNLRDFGFGKSSMEEQISFEVRDLISEFRNQLDKPFNVTSKIRIAVLNTLWQIVSAERYSHDDPHISEFIRIISTQSEEPFIFPLVLPELALAFPKLTGFQSIIDSSNVIYGFFREIIVAHKKILNVNDPRDLVDVYLREIQNTKDENSSFYSDEGERDLFLAGMETTSTILTYIILHLVTNPGVQEKLQIEIDTIIGAHRIPTLLDRPMMPYLEAVICETFRIAVIIPFGIPHTVTESFELEGYTIPKDTIVAVNSWQLQHDKEYWGDPETYRPERFLNEDGQFRNDEALMPFSVGKRACPAETLSRSELFLFVTGLMQQFHFGIDGNNPPNLASNETGMLIKPEPFNVIITERNL